MFVVERGDTVDPRTFDEVIVAAVDWGGAQAGRRRSRPRVGRRDVGSLLRHLGFDLVQGVGERCELLHGIFLALVGGGLFPPAAQPVPVSESASSTVRTATKLVLGARFVGRCALGCTGHSVTTSFSALTPFRSRVSVFGMASSPWPVTKGAGAVW